VNAFATVLLVGAYLVLFGVLAWVVLDTIGGGPREPR
jgi:hypothetical protein